MNIRPKYLIITADIVIAYLALFSAYAIRFSGNGYDLLWDEGGWRIASYVTLCTFAAYFFELQEVRSFKDPVIIVRRVIAALLVAFVSLSAYYFLFPSQQLGRGLLFLSLFFFGIGLVLLRLIIRRFSGNARFASRVLILGTGEYAEKIANIIPSDVNPHSYVRFVRCGKDESSVSEDKIIGHVDELSDLIYDYRPHKIIVSLTDRRGALPLKDIMHCKLRGVEVLDAATFYEQETGCLLIENVQPSAFIYTHGFRMTNLMRSYKRIFDIIFSVIGLSITLPFFPIVALIIKLDSPGPVFYKQLRVGEREVEFFVYKFRTMGQDAEKETGAVWAQKDDPRVTKVGAFMRKTRIDEIPQLFNVLKGDMSFVGPRPERLAFVERLKLNIPFYSTRHFVKPGVTGWAQVCYPYGASEEDALEKLRYDLFYIKNYSIFLDFKIIMDTVRVVLSGFGGR
ncbi:sugar transferase, PEP-CTERM system associated/exopolysaccharide biosynthesis polyprenyl glycosylphosphotransferase [Malonomonas rubra DSM 5091]|uniref:Sugar transferase, PEP-CTERM system associated/exopolysaccharide biosynthesis polyprenyl glycosylphosphotransferase n=1 Tax=Malonomonas rubra DSM 5091 TaxID=1122189 RepID=A0A1M6KF34_MALRU|nr:TIGR03013 family XrtA/PEP-CTERM system glycosyltransferase [Malonomonas rubra]SHJ57518.1 sugar transferase, PEP-CTERM system associated/exopolysaccharide biosynthesis polyprenyl glycosylphosphotransferase [Malonomonas rubra DSM 5091]